MATPFPNSLRSLELDSRRGGALMLLALALLLSAWLGWLLFASVGLYEVSRSARLEVAAALHAVETPKAGRVVASYLEVGRQVDAGDVLVVLDGDGAALRLQEARARVAALDPQLDRLRHELVAEVRAWTEAREAAALALREARAEAKEGAAVDRLAKEEAKRVALLRAEGLLSEVDLLKADSRAEQTAAAVERLELSVQRKDQELAAEASTHEARIERLRRLLAGLEGELSTAITVLRRFEGEVEAHVIRSPVAGTLGETAELEVGAFVGEGERVCSVVPPGDLMVHAEFRPDQALARIRPGQSARLRFDGFPWSRFGTVSATVARVAGETRNGLVRVELAIGRPNGTSIPLVHGLPATAEIEIGRVSPASLLLRRVGTLASQPHAKRLVAEAGS